jgi:hydrogenase maturation protease
MSVVVIGVGNVLRGDDAIGPTAAERVRAGAPADVAVSICEAEPSRLIDAFENADVAILIDATSTGAPPGTVHRFDASTAPVPSHELRSSTHALGIGEALELARALGRLPRRTIVFGVEGSDYTARDGMTSAVGAAVEHVSAAVLEEVAACTSKV